MNEPARAEQRSEGTHDAQTSFCTLKLNVAYIIFDYVIYYFLGDVTNAQMTFWLENSDSRSHSCSVLCCATNALCQPFQQAAMDDKSPLLYRFVRQKRYDNALDRMTSHPEEALWSNAFQRTVLHVLCDVPPHSFSASLLALTKTLVNRHPEMVAQPCDMGWTPLHYCAHQQNSKLLLTLIQACPYAVACKEGRSQMQRTPFHICLMANAPEPILRAMLEIDPSLALQRCRRELFGYYHDESRSPPNMSPLQVLWNTHGVAAMSKLELVLTTVFTGKVVDGDGDFVLHAACYQPCPDELFLHILNKYPEQAMQVDQKGNLPLHYAVAHASIERMERYNWDAVMRNKHAVNEQVRTGPYANYIVEQLLQTCPQAASKKNGQGQLALHAAVSNPHVTWNQTVMDQLIMAYPEALQTCDAAHGLYPALAAAASVAHSSSRLNLSATYQLLRAAPEIVKNAL